VEAISACPARAYLAYTRGQRGVDALKKFVTTLFLGAFDSHKKYVLGAALEKIRIDWQPSFWLKCCRIC